jgi:hypothetical protein
MATASQILASRANGARSEGPTSAEGLRISSMNALKHGFRSERVAEEVESSSALEERRRTWLAQCDAQTDMDEFLITSNVVLSFNLERVWRAAAACLDREKASADDKAIDRARELGSRLYFDPTGPISKYGIENVVFDQVGTSSSGEKDEANQPAALVNELASTPVGCKWLLSEWGLLRDRAVNGIWYSPDRLKAVRLLGFQPVDAIDQWCVAMIFVASHGFMRLGQTGFEDLRSDMSPDALERLVLRVKARFRDLFFDWTETDYRQMLIDLIDENVLALQAQLEWHKTQNARCGGDRKGDELAFDCSPRGASMRQYELRCKTSLERGVSRFNKQAQDRIKGAGKGAAGRTHQERRGRDGSRAEGEETYGRRNGGEQPDAEDARRARAEAWERVEQNLDASDIRACGGFLPLDRTGLASGTLTEGSAGAAVAGGHSNAAGGECGETSLLADAATADCGENVRARRPTTAARGGSSPPSGEESFTNEPELHEDVICSQNQEIVELTADSGVDSGLDNVADLLGAGGREAPEVGDPEFDEEDRAGDERTGDDGRVTELDAISRAKNPRIEDGRTSRGRRAPNADCGEVLRARRPPNDDVGGTSSPSEEDEAELRELQAQLAIETVKRQARAGPMAGAIRDLMASSPEAMEVLKPFLPRGP